MDDQTNAMIFEGTVRNNYDETDVVDVEETTEASEIEEDVDVTEPTEEVEQEDRPKDKNIQALDAERARRKKAEAELKELRARLDSEKQAQANEEKVKKEQENLKQKLMEDGLIDEEVADRLMATLGNQIVSNTIAETTRKEQESFDGALSNLMKEETFYDADKYKDEIRALVDKGLTMEQAYFASVGGNRFNAIRKEAEIEAEQRFLNNSQRADNIDVGTAQSKGEMKRTKYTTKEQRIANESGLNVKDVHKRLTSNTLDEFLNL